MYCAPARENQKLTCYSHDSLIKIARAYNNKYGKNGNKRIKISGKTKVQLWNDIRRALSDRCENEICWIDQSFMRNAKGKEINRETFRPKMPKEWKKNMTTWLTTDDINLVMKQYEQKYPDFFFIGPVPLDCGIGSKLRCELTNFDINKMYNSGIKKLGIIYNLDTSDMPGSHWTAVFANLKRNGDISYYDSYGSRAPPDIQNLMKKMQEDINKKHNLNLKLKWNKTRHQFDGFNCGVYSMYYIVNRLKGKQLEDVERMKISTKKMQEMKMYFYRNTF